MLASKLLLVLSEIWQIRAPWKSICLHHEAWSFNVRHVRHLTVLTNLSVNDVFSFRKKNDLTSEFSIRLTYFTDWQGKINLFERPKEVESIVWSCILRRTTHSLYKFYFMQPLNFKTVVLGPKLDYSIVFQLLLPYKTSHLAQTAFISSYFKITRLNPTLN